jgi:hypothetical protein
MFIPRGAENLKRQMVDRAENLFKKVFEVDVDVVSSGWQTSYLHDP